MKLKQYFFESIKTSGLFWFLALFGAVNQTIGQNLPDFKLSTKSWNSSAVLANDYMGYKVVAKGNAAFVGSLQRQISGRTIGDITPYTFANGIWTEGTRISPPGTLVSGANFGAAIAFNGNWLVSGVPNDQRVAGSGTGSAYIYEKVGSSYVQRQVVSSVHPAQSPKGNNQFGFATAMNNTWLFVGVPGDDSTLTGTTNYLNSNNNGAVVIYKLVSGVWQRHSKLAHPNAAAGSRFGYTLACNENELFVGAPFENSNAGAVYQFRLIGDIWTPVSQFNLSGALNFGLGIDVSQNFMMISAPFSAVSGVSSAGRVAVYFDSLRDGNWKLVQTLTNPVLVSNASMGFSVSLNGELAALGGYRNGSFDGEVNLFGRDGNRWKYIKSFTDPNGTQAFARFGFSVALAANHMIVGSPNRTVNSLSQCGAVEFFKTPEIIATQNKTDGYIDVEWMLNTFCAQTSPPSEMYFQLWDNTNQKELFSKRLDDIQNLSFVTGNYRHYVNPGSSIDYEARILQYGSGALMCGPYSAQGKTLSHIAPEFLYSTPSKDMLGAVFLSFRSNSTFSDKIRIYRNNELLTILDSSEKFFEDFVNIDDSKSIKNGTTYNYCLDGIKPGTSIVSNKVCGDGGTIAADFKASDDEFADKIVLSWNNPQQIYEYVLIERDGTRLVSVSSKLSGWTDKSAIPGQVYEYTLTYFSDGIPVLKQRDNGKRKANGQISGFVLNKNGGFGLHNVDITISGIVNNLPFTSTTKTDARGYYEFKELYYGESSEITVKAILSGATFSQSEQKVTLNLNSNKQEVNFEGLLSATELGSMGSRFVLSSFSHLLVSDSDYVRLNFPNTHSENIQLYIKRNNLIVASFYLIKGQAGANTWRDLTGVPGEIYEYSLDAYFISGNRYARVNNKISNVSFPAVSGIRAIDFTMNANATDGTVDIEWRHRSFNHKGVSIYRNNIKIADVETNGSHTGSYKDLSGENGKNQVYSLRTYRIPYDNNRYEGPGTGLTLKYPDLKPVINAAVTISSRKYPDIIWDYNFNRNTYNYDGVKIVRFTNGIPDTIAFIHKSGAQNYTDRFADFTQTSIGYKVITFKKNNNYSTGSTVAAPIISIGAPFGFVATNSGMPDGLIMLYWQYSSDDAIDGFQIISGTDTIWNRSDMLSRIYMVPGTYTSSSRNFSLRAYREVNGKRLFSAPVIATGNTSAFPGGTMPAVSILKATRNLPDKVTISWTYPSYYLPEFKIYRDGNYIGSVYNDARVFHDYPFDGYEHLYSVIPVLSSPANRGRTSSVTGRRNHGIRIQGLASNVYNGNGIPEANVILEEMYYSSGVEKFRLIEKTKTDSNGYYAFNRTTLRYEIYYRVHIDARGALISDNDQFISYYNQKQEIVNFTDTTPVENTKSDLISRPVRFKAISNQSNNSVELTWSLNGTNYSGFELYRGMELIRKISAGEVLYYEDLKGAPGTSYSYRIRSYWENEPGNIVMSPYSFVIVEFPKLEAVTDLVATPMADYLQLSWNHVSDNHKYYEIRRNGNIIGTVNTGENMLFSDSTGGPTIKYTYTVTSVDEKAAGLFFSLKTSIQADYPEKLKVKDLTAVRDSNMIELRWNPASDLTTFYSIFRAGTKIGTVKAIKAGGLVNRFQDTTGLPLQSYRYEVKAGYIRGGKSYESKSVFSDQVFPQLAGPTNVVASPRIGQDKVTITWKYNYKAGQNFLIYRRLNGTGTEELLSQTPVARNTFTFDDFSGLPGSAYVYYVAVRDNRGGTLVTSRKVPSSLVAFPTLSQPFSASGSISEQNIVSTFWKYNSEDPSIIFQIREDSGYARYQYELNCSPLACNYIMKASSSKSNRFGVSPLKRSWFKLNHTGSNRTIWFPFPSTNAGCPGWICNQGGNDIYQNYFYVRAAKPIGKDTYYSSWTYIPLSPSTPNRLTNSEISVFKASKNAYIGKVLLEWTFTGNINDVRSFKLYRDNVLLESVDPAQIDYYDQEPVPGKRHNYSIHVDYKSNGTATGRIGRSDFGFCEAIGEISGNVVTATGNFGVPGVLLTATATIDGDIYRYTTTSGSDGSYVFPKVYYGTKAQYTVTAAYAGHTFEKSSQTVVLDDIIQRATLPDFRDLSAYVISGVVTYNQGCGIDSVRVKLISKYKNSTPAKTEEAYTNSEGRYSFNIDPNNSQLASLEIVVSDTQTRQNGSSSVTRFHSFTNKYKRWNSFSNWPLSQEWNLEDNLLYPVNLEVRNTCGVIGNYRFNVNIESADKCVSRTVVTASNGKLSLNLPPYNYTITVTGATPADANVISVIDYLNVRPQNYNISEIDKNGGNALLKSGKYNAETVSMIFHKAPQISITSNLQYLCNNPNNPIFMKQDDTMKMQLAVFEQHGAIKCHVDNGFIVVRNEASEVQLDTIWLNANKTAFNPFSFVVGSPMVIAPYTRPLIFEYHTESDGFLAELVNSCAIDGIANQEGSDVIVTNNDKQTFEIPLMVLRDPPGDESYSYIEKGTTFTRTLSMSDRNSGYGGFRSENEFRIFGIGGAFETEIKASGGTGRSAEYSLSVTARQRIETPAANSVRNAANNNFLLGSASDVIVGVGVALQYGIGEKIIIDNATCNIKKVTVVTISPQKVNTTWVYTVDHIKKLITDYRNDSVLLENGQFEISGKTREAARNELIALIKNWESVLRYHFYDNVPYVQLCNQLNYNSVPEPFRTQIRNWTMNGFCREAGSYVKVMGKDTFVPKRDLVFTQALIDKYNKVSDVVSNLTNDEFQFKFRDGLVFSQSALDNWNIGAGAKQFYGAEAENITFSGNTSIEKSVTVTQTKNRGYQQFWSFDWDNFLGVVFETDVKIVTVAGLGVMVGTEQQVVGLDQKMGAIFGYNHEFERSQNNEQVEENTVGYVLKDNDAGDQFSVTVIRGNDPLSTPYFQLVGGRSSCPPEPGTIYRDQPVIDFQDENGQFVNAVQYDLDPDKILNIPVKLGNAAPVIFNDNSYFTLSQVQNQNRYGARLFISGVRLGTAEYQVPSGDARYANLEIERAEKYFDYDDIAIAFGATCPNTEDPDNYTQVVKVLELHYRHPCSDVSIINPGDNWVLRKATSAAGDPDEKLIVRIADYDYDNQYLDKITLQYRRIGSDIWNDISSVTRDSLKSYFLANRLTYKDPVYPFVWNIKGNAAIADGDYELRAQSWCGKNGVIYSNVVRGKIDRTTIVLFGQPQPSDGLLNLGDEVSVTFNKNILCGITDANFTFRNAATNAIIPATVSCFGNKLIFTFQDDIATLDGITVKASVNGVRDLNDNVQSLPIEWTFKIINNPVYWSPEVLNVEMYQGKKQNFKAALLNTVNGNYNYTLSLKNGTWLKMSPVSDLILPSGKQISAEIDATQLTPGTYRDTVTATVPGYSLLRLPVNLTVYPREAGWIVNPAKFEGSATVICNYMFDSSEILSSDTLDRIAAFINGEVRGVANIVKTGSYFRAYMNIFGNSADIGKPVEFNVWHAKSGIEYAGKMRGSINFSVNGFYGTTLQPRILDVNSVSDSIRYIPLKAGWNHLAFNTVILNSDPNKMLSKLKASDGDVIKTLDKTSYFNAETGKWISASTGLKALSTNEGYMIRVSKDDTLKVFGRNAQTGGSFNLIKGWNLIGNPYQNGTPINNVLYGNAFSNGAKIKNDQQAAEFDSATSLWNGFSNLQVNKSYLLQNGKPSVMVYNRSGEDLNCEKLNAPVYEMNSTFLAEIKLNGLIQANSDDRVVAFSGNECRGSGKLEFMADLNKYALNMFVYSNQPGEKITFKIYNAATGMWYDVADTMNFSANGQYGSPSRLWVFSNRKDFDNSTRSNLKPMNINAYPNPFNNEIRFRYESKGSRTVRIELLDLQGRVFVNKNINVDLGMNDKVISLNNTVLSEGVYILRITDGMHAPFAIRMVKGRN